MVRTSSVLAWVLIVIGALALMKEALPVIIPLGMCIVGWVILKVNKHRRNGSNSVSNRY